MTDISMPGQVERPSFTLGYVAIALMFVCAPAGLILSYIDRPKASPVLANHYTYLIGTFWKGLLYWFISFLLSFVLIGLVLMVAVSVWYIIRCVKSLVYLNRGEAIAKPGSWLV